MATETLYAKIANKLAQDIVSGKLKVGDTLPKEIDLAANLNVSRQTVRAALADLEARKLVSRRRNVGTRVESAAPGGAYSSTLSSVDDLVQWAKTAQRRIRKTRDIVMDIGQARELGCEPGSRWLLVQSLRFDSKEAASAVAWADSYIAEIYRGVLPRIRSNPSMLMSVLFEQQFGIRIAKVEQVITASLLHEPEAIALNTKAGQAALRIVRRYLDGTGRPVLVTVTLHPAERFAVTTVLDRS